MSICHRANSTADARVIAYGEGRVALIASNLGTINGLRAFGATLNL